MTTCEAAMGWPEAFALVAVLAMILGIPAFLLWSADR